MTIQAMKYAKTPHPPKITSMSQMIRTKVGSTSKYSANPPQTPAIFLSVRERISFLVKWAPAQRKPHHNGNRNSRARNILFHIEGNTFFLL